MSEEKSLWNNSANKYGNISFWKLFLYNEIISLEYYAWLLSHLQLLEIMTASDEVNKGLH